MSPFHNEARITFTNAFMPAPVCSACRSGIITGIMPTTIGVQNHHSSRTEESAIYLPENVKTIPELFKAEGYYTFNNGKDDFNFMYNRFDLYDQPYYQHPIYGKCGERIDLAILKEKEPFFGQIQMYGGTRVPLIIARYINNKAVDGGIVNTDLISGLDIGTTSLCLAGIEIPENMDGIDFFAEDFNGREYVISSRDRCDFTIDRIRSVRSKDFKYIRNFMTDRPYMQKSYMDVDSVASVLRMKELYRENKLNEVQSRFMSEERPSEELYDLHNDPFEIKNLANDPAYADVLNKYKNILDEWVIKTDDKGQYPENKEGLKFMLGIWGNYVENPEYKPLIDEDKDFPGSLFYLKSEKWKKFSNTY